MVLDQFEHILLGSLAAVPKNQVTKDTMSLVFSFTANVGVVLTGLLLGLAAMDHQRVVSGLDTRSAKTMIPMNALELKA